MNGVTAFIDLKNVQGTHCYGVRGTDWNLVKRDPQSGSFEPLDKLETGLGSTDLDANYGVWVDKEVTKGHLWWKKVERPQDGKIQADEVIDFPSFRKNQVSHVWHQGVGGDELYTFDSAQLKVQDQAATLQTDWTLHRGDWSRYWEPMSPLAPPNR